MSMKKLPENKKRQTVIFTTSKENIEKLDRWISKLKEMNFHISRSSFLEKMLLDYLNQEDI